jgi:hypothetical protein
MPKLRTKTEAMQFRYFYQMGKINTGLTHK